MTLHLPPPEVDVAIIGGGPAGAATALALRRSSDLSVALVERSAGPRPKIGETVPPGCRPLLERLGAWESFQADGHAPAHGSCSAWGSPELAYHDFLFRPHGAGWHLDRSRFDERLLELAAQSGVFVLRPATVVAEPSVPAGRGDRRRWQLKLRRTEEAPFDLKARFVVDASGRSASFARRQGAHKILFDHLVGTYCFFALDAEHPLRDSFTLVEAAEEGWWYSALLPEKRLVAAYMTDADHLRAGSLRDARPWLAHAQGGEHTRRRLEGARALTDPSVAMASSHLLAPIGGQGWLAVGDAASSFDPLSAQGIMHALEGALQAAEAVREHLQGERGRVEAYQQRVTAEFEHYLELRQRYYRLETRWPHASFWWRRQGSITLHPSQKLRCVTTEPAAGLKMHLPPGHLRELAHLCRTARPAHELVSAFRQRTANAYSDRRVILALQYLIRAGALAPHF